MLPSGSVTYTHVSRWPSALVSVTTSPTGRTQYVGAVSQAQLDQLAVGIALELGQHGAELAPHGPEAKGLVKQVHRSDLQARPALAAEAAKAGRWHLP